MPQSLGDLGVLTFGTDAITELFQMRGSDCLKIKQKISVSCSAVINSFISCALLERTSPETELLCNENKT